MQKIRYGVFQVREDWKLYSEGEGSRSFGCRASAVAAGERAAREALLRGCEVELHLQEASGEFRQADMLSLAH